MPTTMRRSSAAGLVGDLRRSRPSPASPGAWRSAGPRARSPASSASTPARSPLRRVGAAISTNAAASSFSGSWITISVGVSATCQPLATVNVAPGGCLYLRVFSQLFESQPRCLRDGTRRGRWRLRLGEGREQGDSEGERADGDWTHLFPPIGCETIARN